MIESRNARYCAVQIGSIEHEDMSSQPRSQTSTSDAFQSLVSVHVGKLRNRYLGGGRRSWPAVREQSYYDTMGSC
jgi:hypothetical protein